VITLLGFIANRLNISLIGFETYVGHHYMPKWTEFSVTLMIIAMGFFLFGVAVKYLPIFPEQKAPAARLHRIATESLAGTPALTHAGD
jgi:Ni/Fe-hydrogenase subunit HybB-like protein